MDDMERSQRDIVRQLEERLLQPEVRRSAQDLAELLADEFIEFGSSGHVFNKLEILEHLQHEEPAKRSFSDFRATLLAPGVMLTTYRSTRLNAQGTPATSSLRSSIWKLQDGHWKMVFHQGTLAADS